MALIFTIFSKDGYLLLTIFFGYYLFTINIQFYYDGKMGFVRTVLGVSISLFYHKASKPHILLAIKYIHFNYAFENNYRVYI